MKYVIFILFIPIVGHSQPGTAIVLNATEKYYVIGQQTAVFVDTSRKTTVQTIRSIPDNKFLPLGKPYPIFKDTRPTYWFRFQIRRQTTDLRYLLEVAFGNIRHINLYIVNSTGQINDAHAGDDVIRTGRYINFPTYLLPLTLTTNELHTVYLRINNQGPHAYFPLIIREETAGLNYMQINTLLWGFYWGVLILMLLYHLIIWGFTRERGYFYLGLYLLTYAGFELSRGSNLGIRYLWPNSPMFALHSLELFSVLVLFSFTFFYSHILALRHTVPVLFWILNCLCIIGSLMVANSLLGLIPVQAIQITVILSSYPLVIIMFLAGLITWQRGQQSSRYYITASMCYAIGFTVFVLNRSGILPGMSLLAHYSQNIGSLFEIAFMSVGLASYVREQRRQRLDEERRHAATEQRRLAEQLQRKEAIDNALAEGQIQERRRVADELHDQLGSVLFGIRTHLTELERSAPHVEPEVLKLLQRTVQEGYNEVRLIAHNLWPEELEKQGLGTTLAGFVNSLNRIGKTRFALQLSGAEDQLDRTSRFHMYCICLELVNNVLKHAQANEASVRFLAEGTDLRLSVRDDGVGFGPGSSDGRGLKSVEERVARLNGTFSISYLPEGEGSWIQIRVPLPQQVSG